VAGKKVRTTPKISRMPTPHLRTRLQRRSNCTGYGRRREMEKSDERRENEGARRCMDQAIKILGRHEGQLDRGESSWLRNLRHLRSVYLYRERSEMPKRIGVKQSAHRPSLQKEAWSLQKCAAAGSAAKILKIYTVYHRTPLGQGFLKTMILHLTTGRKARRTTKVNGHMTKTEKWVEFT
jgi:hypothetical protein